MILIRRAAEDFAEDAPASSPSQAVHIPWQAGTGRSDAINVGTIARKPRAVANVLQRLYGI